MEAKRNALEAIVRKPNGMKESEQGSPQKSPQRSQNGGQGHQNGLLQTATGSANAHENAKSECSELPVFTRDFEGGYPQKSPQSGILEGHRGVYRNRKSKKIIGSSGKSQAQVYSGFLESSKDIYKTIKINDLISISAQSSPLRIGDSQTNLMVFF